MVLFARKEKGEGKQGKKEGMRLGKYELGRTLGEGNFGKVKYAKDVDSGHPFAVKILEKTRIIDLKITDQIKREIGTLKLLKHPNVVQLHEVIASKTKIYMVLEYVNGGELFDRIASKGKLLEAEGRKLFQQLVDGVSYCHNKGVFHRDLKLENVLVDAKGNIKISDFGLSALPQHFRDDGLLHTTCGSPNYVAPEILQNRGYDGSTSDTWSCGVILYVILTGHLPFDDRNLAVLYQKIFKGEAQIPKWLSSGAKNLIRRILDPNPRTRLTMAEIKEDKWFKQDYIPTDPEEREEDAFVDDEAFLIHEPPEVEKDPESPTIINAFQLIGMSSCLDLSGFFEKEDVSERKIRFTSNHSPKELIERIEDTVMQMGFGVLKKNGWMMVTTIIELVIDKLETKNMIIPVLPGVVNTVNNVKLYQLIPPSELKVIQQEHKGQKSMVNLSVAAKVFEISPSLYVVELRKFCGDSEVYRQLCTKLSHDLGVSRSQELLAMEF